MQPSLVELASLPDFVPGEVAQMRRSVRTGRHFPPAVGLWPGFAGIASSRETYCQCLSDTVPNSHSLDGVRSRARG
jgi:hypothetical protein